MLVSFRLLIASGVLALSTTKATAVGAQARTDTTLAIDGNATVEVVGWADDVTVSTGTDRTLRVRGDGDARVDVRGTRRAVLLDASGPRGGGRLALVVPRGTTLLVRTQSGNVTVRGTGADVEVRSTSGDVLVEDAARLRVETMAGDISARDVRDGVRISATSGDVQLAAIDGDVEVTGTSTTVSLRDVSSRRVAVKVVSGDVRWAGPFSANGRYDFSAHSGDVRFTLPRTTRATLDVRTFNGDVSSRDVALTLVPDPVEAERTRARDQEREQQRQRVRALRDSVERVLADSLRRDARSRDRRGTWERDFERSVERMVESVMRGLAVGMESLAAQLEAGTAGLAERGRGRRFTLGGDGGPLVSVSTFSGNVTFSSVERP
jgi:hypothetical protein